jgi:hypothetical protein
VSKQESILQPIFTSIDDIRERLHACQGCEQRREIIQRWLAGEKLKMQGLSSPLESMPRDMSVLKQEK